MVDQVAGQTLIVIKGNFCYRAGRTYVVGDKWITGDNLRMLICCAHLSGVFIYTPILFEDFMYTMSRMRCMVKDIQTRGDGRGAVFMNMEGVWFGKEQVMDYKTEYKLDLDDLRANWEKQWG